MESIALDAFLDAYTCAALFGCLRIPGSPEEVVHRSAVNLPYEEECPPGSSDAKSHPPELKLYSFDAKYVESLCAGDRRTQEHFVSYFAALLKVKLRSRPMSSDAIADICEETFARVFAVLRREGGLRQPERLGAFVNAVCNNVLFERYRSANHSESLDAGGVDPAAVGAVTSDVVAARKAKEGVRAILLRLSERDRILLRSIFLDGLDRDDICRQFGVDRDYLRALIHRVKQERSLAEAVFLDEHDSDNVYGQFGIGMSRP